MVLTAVAAIVLMAPYLVAVWTIWIAHSSPQRLLDIYDGAEQRKDTSIRIRCWLVIGLSVVGYGMFAHGGTNSALSWMPHSWGDVDEEGGFKSLRTSISYTAAVIGSLAFAGILTDYCHVKARLQSLDEAKQASSTTLRT